MSNKGEHQTLAAISNAKRNFYEVVRQIAAKYRADVLLPTCKAEGYTYGLENSEPVFTELATGEKIPQGHAKLPWMKSAFRVLRVEMYPRVDPLWNYVRSISKEEIDKTSAA